jgi:hypothetical protein
MMSSLIMFLIPYTHTTKVLHGRIFHTVRILLEGGKTPWQEDDSCHPTDDALEPNNLFVAEPLLVQKNHVFARIDPQRTDMKSMYAWKELPLADKETLCWRTFHYVTDSAGTPWIHIPDIPFSLREILQAIIHPKA